MDQRTIDIPENSDSYERLYQLYLDLKQELETLEKQGKILSREIQAAIDHEKIHKIFQFIKRKGD